MKKILLMPDGKKPPAWVKIKSTTKRLGYDIVTGENDTQYFIEYWKGGKPKGMILRLKGEKFWTVWKFIEGNPMVQTKKARAGVWVTIGSKNKDVAIRKLKEMI